MKSKMVAKSKTKTETKDPLWEDLKRGFEDAKAGRIRIWKPRVIQNHE